MPKKKKLRKIKTEIPRALHMAIIRLQASEDLDYDQACLKAAELIDVNSEEFKAAVQAEANTLQKSQFMSMMNKSKNTWRKKGYDDGFKNGEKMGHQLGVEQNRITYHCSVCGGDIVMKPGAEDHEAMKKMMRQAGWAHSTCLNKK